MQVWDLPLRLWHWLLAILVVVAWFTPTAYDRAHRLVGYAVIGLLVFRLVWGFGGSRYSQFRMVGDDSRPRRCTAALPSALAFALLGNVEASCRP